jgi:hypothetical protein
MRLSAHRTMNGLKGGGIANEDTSDQRVPRGPPKTPATSVGKTGCRQACTPPAESNFSGQRRTAPRRCGVRQLAGRPLLRRIGGVDRVHTFAFGLGRTSVGSGRIPHVSAGAQCLQGLECSSSPTSGTVFPQVRGFLVFLRVDTVHALASDLMFRVCGVPGRPIWLCGGAADYGGPGTALWGPFWVFILVRPSLGFSRSPLHDGQGRLQHDLLIILWIDRGLRPVRNLRSDTCSCRNAEGTA